ncbi:sigma-70 family RNA polymerase sigma factor [Reichenbachiella sp. MALMAid0571]|uniref:RNA polymerase sigma factor n=1 Tax=Reichenbachiella sp. MALMAid0571 TaxID=3143939 RepID=UPI0032DE62EB
MREEVDIDLVRFLSGNKAAFERMYKQYYPELYNYARQFQIDQAATNDCIQDVFIEIWNSRKRLKIKSIRPYLFTSVRNKITKYRSKSIKEQLQAEKYHQEEFEVKYNPSLTQVESENKLELEKRLKKGVENLTPRQKEIIFLIFYNDLNYSEAAEILGIKVKTAYNQVHKSINDLRDLLIAIFILYSLNLTNRPDTSFLNQGNNSRKFPDATNF